MQFRDNPKLQRIAASSVTALLAANAMVLIVGIADDEAAAPAGGDPKTRTVTLITGEDGTQTAVDPSTPEGAQAVEDAEERGDEVSTVPAAQAPASATATTAPGSTSGTTARPSAPAASSTPTTLLPVIGGLRPTVTTVLGAVDDAAEELGDTIDGVVDDATDTIDDTLGTDTGSTVDPIVDQTTDTVVDVVDDVTDVVDDTVGGVLDGAGSTIDDTVGGVVGGATGGGNPVGGLGL
jgi:hypothetical protein